MTESSLTLWTQLPDPTSADIIEIDGVTITEHEVSRRERAVSSISRVANSRRRNDLPGGGFIAWSGRHAVAEIPVDSAKVPDVFPLITLSLRAGRGETPLDEEQIVQRVERFASAAGYTVDRLQLHAVIKDMLLGLRPSCFTPWRSYGRIRRTSGEPK